ncbi:MAG: DivIVA domain-containing protein [Bacteroidota bacterium]
MKITPLDIRQKHFEKKTFGGVDKDEVSAFLNTVSQAWEKQLEENRELKIRLEASEREAAKLREVERSLYLTLKNAEETGAGMIEQSNKAAALTAQEARLKAETLLNDARNQARHMLEDAEEKSRKTYLDLQQEVKALEHDYRNLENMRDNLLSDLVSLSRDISDRTERAANRIRSGNMFIAATPAAEIGHDAGSKQPTTSWSAAEEPAKPSAFHDDEQAPKSSGSFFDRI